MKKYTWTNRDFWRTAAFKQYRDSRNWRYLLELNPSYDIRFRPAEGVDVYTSGYVGEDTPEPNNSSAPGILRVPSLDIGSMTTDNQPPLPRSLEVNHFPWNTPEGYVNRLGGYTAQARLTKDRTNGFSLDSPQALSDTQRG